MSGDPSFRADLYRGTARDYDSFRLPYPRSLVDDLRSRAGLSGTGRLLDVACGTGQIAFALSTAFAEIVALDQEPETVAFGRAKSEAVGFTHMTWQVGTAEEADVPGPFDMVAIGNAFHRLRRQRVAERALSWLRSGGYAVLLWGGNPTEGDGDWQEVLRGVMVDWPGRAGDRLPADWEEAMARESHEQVLTRVGFSYEGGHDFAVRHVWTIETLTGYLYSTSVLSRQALDDLAPSFEEDLSVRMLGCRPNGRFEQAVRFSYQLAQKLD
jgi:SAM-dependent methyltransferase